MCSEKTAEYSNNLVKAGGNFTAHDLRDKTVSILPSHVDAINAFLTERDTKIEESQRFDPAAWLDIGAGEDLHDALDAICENAFLNRRITTGDMLVTKPRPSHHRDEKCLAIEAYDSYPRANSENVVNAVFNFDEKSRACP